MKKLIYLFSMLAFFAVISCETSENGDAGAMDSDGQMVDTVAEIDGENQVMGVMEKDGLKVYPKEDSPNFENSTLQTTAPENGSSVKAGEVKFTYDIENYELGAQTENANGLANSGDGQHIHAILNNNPYMAKYKPEFTTELEKGHYVLLSFLSRSYHESVKSEGAYDIIQFSVGDAEAEQADLSAPHMFYSRPKGEYMGDDTQKLLLDWYLVNCDLSAEGYKVKATLNGTEFTFSNWQPYIVEGLPMGEVNVRLELIDGEGNTVESPFNPVERTVTLKAAEAGEKDM